MVIWTKPAKDDLRSIHDFIANNSRHYAKKITQDISEKTDVLDKLPRIGKMVSEISDENVKQLSLYSFEIFMKSEVKTYSFWLWCIREVT